MISLKWTAGSQQTPAQLGSDGAFVSKDYAKAKHLHVGSPLALEMPSGADAASRPARHLLAAEGRLPVRRRHDLAGAIRLRLSEPAERLHVRQHRRRRHAANTAKLKAALGGFPDAKLQTKSQFTHNQLSGVDTLLNLLYVLLSLSIVVSLFGIVNTLVLTVFERTRELGMLRAVGMTRRQVRRMIRHESIITALLGAAFGIPLGVVLALMVGVAIKYPAFTIPVGTLVVFVIAAIIAGMVAAILPARRAGKLERARGAPVRVALGLSRIYARSA